MSCTLQPRTPPAGAESRQATRQRGQAYVYCSIRRPQPWALTRPRGHSGCRKGIPRLDLSPPPGGGLPSANAPGEPPPAPSPPLPKGGEGETAAGGGGGVRSSAAFYNICMHPLTAAARTRCSKSLLGRNFSFPPCLRCLPLTSQAGARFPVAFDVMCTPPPTFAVYSLNSIGTWGLGGFSRRSISRAMVSSSGISPWASRSRWQASQGQSLRK